MSRGSAGTLDHYVTQVDAKRIVHERETAVLDALGIPWGRGNPHITCPYPGHDDDNPSWRWDLKRHCAFCTCLCGPRRSHSIFDVVMAMEGVDFPAACVRVAEILDPSVIKSRRAADFAGCRLDEYAVAKKLPVTHLRSFGLREIRMRGKPVVLIPYVDIRGHDIATRFRVSLDGKPKLIWKKGSSISLYGLDRLHLAERAGYIVVCEGESDVQTAVYHDVPALGLPGNTTWNEGRDAPHFANIDTVYLAVEPGQSGAGMLRSLSKSSIRPRLRLIYFTESVKDISALHIADPGAFKVAFKDMMDAAEPCPPPTQVSPTVAVNNFIDDVDGGQPGAFDGPYYREFGSFTMDAATGLVYTPDDPSKNPMSLAVAFEVVAWVRDSARQGLGLLLRWRDREGYQHEWILSARLLVGRPEEVLQPLVDGGLKISSQPVARNYLLQYLGAVEADQWFRLADNIGWLAGEQFFLPQDPITREDEDG